MNVPDNMAGRKAKCPKCSNVFVLPGGSEGVSAAPPPAPAPRAASRRDDDFEDDRPSRGRGRDRDDDDAPRGGGKTNGLAIAGLVLGIIGAVVAWIPCFGWILGIILGIIGAALSGIGLAQASKLGSGKGMAVTGLILSIIAILLGPVVYFIFVAAAVNTLNNAVNNPNLFKDAFKDAKIEFKDGKDMFKDAFKDLKNLKVNFNQNHPPVPGNAKVIDVPDLGANGKKSFEVSFPQGQKAEVWVKSEVDGDVDLFVYEKGGQQVAADIAIGKDCYVTFQATKNEPYKIEISNNFGSPPNRSKIHHTGK